MAYRDMSRFGGRAVRQKLKEEQSWLVYLFWSFVQLLPSEHYPTQMI